MKLKVFFKEKNYAIVKKALSLVLSASLAVSMVTMPVKKVQAADTSFNLTAQQLVDRMGVGWNLGNSLDSAMSYSGGETSWGNPTVTKAMIDEIKKAGFKTIRIPTTWTYKTSGYPNYTIKSDWMDRVEEIVNYAVDNDMYIILNTHHEGGNVIPTYAKQDEVSYMLSKVWTQIATRFEKYGGNLIFEVLNEPRVEGSATEWTGGTAETRAVLNVYNKTCVDAIRATGGNNSVRKVMIPTVAASLAESALTELAIPDDDNIIVSVHAYSPYSFAMQYPGTSTWGSDSDKGSLDWQMQHLYDLFVSKGVPVIIGEFGNVNKNNLSDRITHASYYVQAARKKGITCVWWDNNNNGVGSETFGIFNRNSRTWNYPDLVSEMIASEASVAGDYDDETPSKNTLTGNWVLYDNNQTASKVSDIVININSIGTQDWQPHYYQQGITIEKDVATVFSCTLKSSIDRDVTIHLQIPDNNYETLAMQTLSLKANEAKDVKLYVPAPSEEKSGIKLSICMGVISGVTSLAAHTVEVTNTSLEKVNVVPGVIPVDEYSDKTSSITFTTENGVTYAGNLNDASYLDYKVYVQEAGKYTVGLKLAAGAEQYNADNILVKVNDNTVQTLPIQGSSSWTTFIDHTAEISFDTVGVHKLSLALQGGSCNVTDITLTKKATEEATQPTESTTQPSENQTQPSGEQPEEVFGVVVSSNSDNSITVVWGRNTTMEEKGQLYNVYVDGVKKLSNQVCGSYDIANIPGGTHTVKVTSVLGNNESAGFEGTVTVAGSSVVETTTEAETNPAVSAKVEINGCQISSTVEGYRVVYSVSDSAGEVEEAGLVYGLADKTNVSDMVVGSSNSTVYSYKATEAGKTSVSYSSMSGAQSYAMTMKFVKTAEFYNTNINVRAYIKLKDGSYTYSDVKKYSVYDIADYLYTNLKMNNMSSHDYLYNSILSIANPSYKEIDFTWNSAIVSPDDI